MVMLRTSQESVGTKGLIPHRSVGSSITLDSGLGGVWHEGTLSFLVRSDGFGHTGYAERAEEQYTVPHSVKERGMAAIGSPVWTDNSVQWAAEPDMGTKGIETSVKNNHYYYTQPVFAGSQSSCFYFHSMEDKTRTITSLLSFPLFYPKNFEINHIIQLK